MRNTKKHKSYFSLTHLLLSLAVYISSSCNHKKAVETSFYYWKTVCRSNKAESAWLRHFKVKRLYVRIMDVNTGEDTPDPVPVSAIIFKDKLPDTVQIVPVVFIVNDVLKTLSKGALNELANKIPLFVQGKVEQAGKTSYNELQIDCDWTATTRDNYFYLLRRLKLNPLLNHKTMSVTLRLHQLKNQVKSGIPPANRAMLMCYNMGNLRQYGKHNSILELGELKKYLGDNISAYPMPVNVGLPLFSWAVAFRDKQYIGISKRIKIADLNNKNRFIFSGNDIYKAAADLPEFGLNKADEIRWEDISMSDLQATAGYLSSLIKTDTLNVIYFHLDEPVLKQYHYADLEKVNNLLR